MGKLTIIISAVIGLVALLFAAIFYLTGDIVTAADEFFLATKNKNFDQAYSYLSEDFKSDTSRADLENYLIQNGFDKYVDATWSSRRISGKRGFLEGEIEQEGGQALSVNLTLIKTEDEWKILSLYIPSAGFQKGSAPHIPSEEDQIKLVNTAILTFAQGVEDKSMEKLYSSSSNLWQSQSSVEEMNNIFEEFFNLDLKLTALSKSSPIFNGEAEIKENGFMVIEGYYPTQPTRVTFALHYVYEGLGWKLAGISIQLKNAEASGAS
ncbi:hypothetical protein ONV78_09645 [Hahella sp. CR1]|uniref:hypothetical protein n=1 Tax=Hahella sp. CR1 TaxID=2992807 RepID=UPI002442FE0C|nr:hypothetical protein [Hahella sp. CR1]MDG9667994.1 hypothetical protein [Hahella sp. CR1]